MEREIQLQKMTAVPVLGGRVGKIKVQNYPWLHTSVCVCGGGEWSLLLTSSASSGQIQLLGASSCPICKVGTQIKVKVKQDATINEQIMNVQ